MGGSTYGGARTSDLFTMDLSSKLAWVLQTGKMTPPGLFGEVFSNFVLDVSFFK